MEARLRAGVLILLFCAVPAAARAGRLQVVATVPDLAALAREVGGERVRVSALLSAAEDPAQAVARPEQALELSRADLLLGQGETGWLQEAIGAAKNPRLTAYLDAVSALGMNRDGGSYGLADPRQAARLLPILARELALRDPAGAALFEKNAAAAGADIERREQKWLLHLAPLRGHKVLSYGTSFRAFLTWAGLAETATLETAPGAPLQPVQVARALRAMRAEGVRLVLQRESEPAAVARLLAERTGAHVLVVPLGARFARGERYVDGIDELVRALIAAARP